MITIIPIINFIIFIIVIFKYIFIYLFCTLSSKLEQCNLNEPSCESLLPAALR